MNVNKLRSVAPLRHESRTLATGWIILIGLAFAGPSLDDGLVSDDYVLIDESRIQAMDDVWTALSAPGMNGFYRPAPRLLLAAQWGMSRLQPFWYHAVNVGIHLTVAVVLFLICLRLTGTGALSLLAGGLFAAHFAHVEPVYWVSARNELLAALLYLLAILWMLRPGRRYQAMSLAAFLAALLSKETAVTFPILVVALSMMRTTGPLAGRSVTALRASAPAAAVLMGYGITRWLVSAVWPWSSREFGFGFHPGLILKNIEQYAVQLVVPVRTLLAFRQDDAYETATRILRDGQGAWIDAGLILGGVVLVVLVKVMVSIGGRATRLGLVFTSITALPFLFMEGTGVRYLYLPSAGFALAAAGVVSSLAARWRQRQCIQALQAMTGCIVILSLAVSVMQARWWEYAGEECSRIIETVARYGWEDGANDPLYVTGIPRRIHGAYIFHNGFDAAMRLHNLNTRRIVDGDRLPERGETIPEHAQILTYQRIYR